MTTHGRADLVRKIKALLAKTVAAGCTEGEMMAALALSAKLMADYRVTASDLKFGGETVVLDERDVDDRDAIRVAISVAVGRFCQVKPWSKGAYNVTFCGLSVDTVFAHWLLDTLAAFVKRELLRHLAATSRPGQPRVRRLATKGFVVGCTGRISLRLTELAHQAHGTGPARGLVVAKNALIDDRMIAEGIKLKRRNRRVRISLGDFHAGQDAGDRATFDRPVDASAEPLTIGQANERSS